MASQASNATKTRLQRAGNRRASEGHLTAEKKDRQEIHTAEVREFLDLLAAHEATRAASTPTQHQEARQALGEKEASARGRLDQELLKSIGDLRDEEERSRDAVTLLAANADKEKSHYEWLGIPEGATTAEIKAAYRSKALHYHPDKHDKEPACQARDIHSRQQRVRLSEKSRLKEGLRQCAAFQHRRRDGCGANEILDNIPANGTAAGPRSAAHSANLVGVSSLLQQTASQITRRKIQTADAAARS